MPNECFPLVRKTKNSPYLFTVQYLSLGLEIPSINSMYIKFIYSEKPTKFCEVFTLLLSYVVLVKSEDFAEYMNFICSNSYQKYKKFCAYFDFE